MAALRASLAPYVARLTAASEDVWERVSAALAGPLVVASVAYDASLPYVVKAFHWGFIPFVILLGMRSEPRPKLTDLLTPM